jgi:hypothetical protein
MNLNFASPERERERESNLACHFFKKDNILIRPFEKNNLLTCFFEIGKLAIRFSNL